MAHPLAKKWKSRVRTSADIHGDFDLRNLTDGGDLSNCIHGPNNDRISGTVDEISFSDAPTAKYLVRIDQEPSTGYSIHYRGVAILDLADNQIHKIIGFKRAIATPFTDDPKTKSRQEHAAIKLAIEALAQDEGTWTGTQP
jgi:hypothetical protein